MSTTTMERAILKELNGNAAWARRVDQMTDEHVTEAILKIASQFRI